MLTGGRNQGRVGTIVHRERHLGGYDIVHIRDTLDREFATRLSNVFVIGQAGKPLVSLPKGASYFRCVRTRGVIAEEPSPSTSTDATFYFFLGNRQGCQALDR